MIPLKCNLVHVYYHFKYNLVLIAKHFKFAIVIGPSTSKLLNCHPPRTNVNDGSYFQEYGLYSFIDKKKPLRTFNDKSDQ